MRTKDGKPQRVKCVGEGRIIAHRHRADRVSVVGVFERDNAALFGPPGIAPELNRHF